MLRELLAAKERSSGSSADRAIERVETIRAGSRRCVYRIAGALEA